MSFVGPVNQLGDDCDPAARPRAPAREPTARREARVERVVHLGFEVRVELALDEGTELWAQMTQEQCEELELAPGSRVHVRPRRARTFA